MVVQGKDGIPLPGVARGCAIPFVNRLELEGMGLEIGSEKIYVEFELRVVKLGFVDEGSELKFLEWVDFEETDVEVGRFEVEFDWR